MVHLKIDIFLFLTSSLDFAFLNLGEIFNSDVSFSVMLFLENLIVHIDDFFSKVSTTFLASDSLDFLQIVELLVYKKST